MITYASLAEMAEVVEKLLDIRVELTGDDAGEELVNAVIHRILSRYTDLAAAPAQGE